MIVPFVTRLLLLFFQIDVIPREAQPAAAAPESAQEHSMIALRLRLAPHRADSQNSTEILADCAIDHPFYVKDKGRKDGRKKER